MIDIQGIQGGAPEISSDLPRQQKDYFVPSYAKKEPASKLYLGEVVQGVIIEIPSLKEAIVRLPNGTFRAELKGNLKPGDTLFFKVAEVSPSLVLKIWAAPSVVSKVQIQTKELVRILDLPENDDIYELIETYRVKKSTVYRDDILMIYRAYVNLQIGRASCRERV